MYDWNRALFTQEEEKMRKYQKALNIILAVTLTFTSFPVTAFAGEAVQSSSEGILSTSDSSAGSQPSFTTTSSESPDIVSESESDG